MKNKRSIRRNDWKPLIAAVERHTVISLRELSSLVRTYTTVAPNYATWLLQQKGIIRRIQGKRQSLYKIIHKRSTDDAVTDPIEAIQALYGQGTIFSYGTALYFHGLSRYGRLTHYYLVSEQSRTQRNVGQVVARLVKTRLGSKIGVTKRKYGTRIVLITDLDRTIVDCIHRPGYAQGWENVMHALSRAKRVNARRLISYVKQYGVPLLAARVGVILEHFAKPWKARTEDIDSLLSYIPRRPIKFERGIKGRLNKKWNIYLPGDLLVE